MDTPASKDLPNPLHPPKGLAGKLTARQADGKASRRGRDEDAERHG